MSGDLPRNLALARREFSDLCTRWKDFRLGDLERGKGGVRVPFARDFLDFVEGSVLCLGVMLAEIRRARRARRVRKEVGWVKRMGTRGNLGGFKVTGDVHEKVGGKGHRLTHSSGYFLLLFLIG